METNRTKKMIIALAIMIVILVILLIALVSNLDNKKGQSSSKGQTITESVDQTEVTEDAGADSEKNSSSQNGGSSSANNNKKKADSKEKTKQKTEKVGVGEATDSGDGASLD